MARFLFFALTIISITARAQFTYVIDQTIPVKAIDDKPLSMPWAGGINAAQYSTIDLNNDGKDDLVLFDRMANKVLTYLNQNNNYQYAPDYESLFPADVTNWILLRDYNCDGKKDLFSGDIFGIKVYMNITTPGQRVSWKKYLFYVDQNNPKSEALLTKGSNGLINLQLQYDDLPALQDADGDGDLDIFNMRYANNSTLEYHQNFSKELYGTCDSLAFQRITQQWGNFTECTCGVFAFNNSTCPTPTGGRTEHAGGKSLLMLDVDGDTDLDLLFSEATCTNLFLLENKGTQQNPIINSAVTYPSSTAINYYIFPAAYYEDVDFDGVKDLISTPNIFSKVYLNSTLGESNWLYKNTGTNAKPNFSFTKTNLLQDQMIDVGDNSVPAFADYDGDGDYDMFISENATTTFFSSLYLYENTGTAEVPEFKLITKDYLNLLQQKLYNLKIQFADITGDNKTDLVFTATSFQTGVTNLYYIANQQTPVFNFTNQPLQIINLTVAYAENIYVHDMNADGKVDILLGTSNGAMDYYENGGNLNFAVTQKNFLGITSSVLRQNPTCTISDLNNDGNEDFLYSDQSGIINILDNFKTAKDLTSASAALTFNALTNDYENHNLGGLVWPTVVNLFNTTKPAIVVGNSLGGVQILRSDSVESISGESLIQLYPNPVSQSSMLNIKTDRSVQMQLFNSIGQTLSEPITITPHQTYSYNVQTLSRGIYLLRFTVNKKSITKRIVIN